MTINGNVYIYGDYIEHKHTKSDTTNNYHIDSNGNLHVVNDGTAPPTDNTHQTALTTQQSPSPEASILQELSIFLEYFDDFDPHQTMKTMVARIMQIPMDSPRNGVRTYFLHSLKANAGTKIRRGDLQLAPLFKLAGFLSNKASFSDSGPDIVDKYPQKLQDPENFHSNLKAYFRKGATQTPDPSMKQDEIEFYEWVDEQL